MDATDIPYVWTVWIFLGCDKPKIERHQLVKRNPGGGATVLRRGSTVVIRPMACKKFYFSEAELLARYRDWHSNELDRARRRVQRLQAEYTQPDMGMEVDIVPGEPRNFPEDIKLE